MSVLHIKVGQQHWQKSSTTWHYYFFQSSWATLLSCNCFHLPVCWHKGGGLLTRTDRLWRISGIAQLPVISMSHHIKTRDYNLVTSRVFVHLISWFVCLFDWQMEKKAQNRLSSLQDVIRWHLIAPLTWLLQPDRCCYMLTQNFLSNKIILVSHLFNSIQSQTTTTVALRHLIL